MVAISKIMLLFGLLINTVTIISSASNHENNNRIPVGVILDMGSWVGKAVNTSISMAISDFYALNKGYKTRIDLHPHDSNGDPLQTLSAALDLVHTKNVQAIIGPEGISETRFLSEFGEKAGLPILSFAPRTSSPNAYKFSLQIAPDETTQVMGIAEFVESCKWRDAILIYEDTDNARQTILHLLDTFQKKYIRVSYSSAISSSVGEDQIFEELNKIISIQTSIFVMHMSPSLASRIFLKASRLKMLTKGYAWIVTDWTMNQFNSLDSEVVLDSMQGVVGFKTYIPKSRELRNFTSRWIKEYHRKNPIEEVRGVDVFALWAYDAIQVMAKAFEKVWMDKTLKTRKQIQQGLDLKDIKASQTATELVNQMFKIRFKGLSGEFQLKNGRQDVSVPRYEIVNVLGKGERRIGFGRSNNGQSQENKNSYPSYLTDNGHLKLVIWPGETTTTPKGWMMQMTGKKLRIGVPALAPFQKMVKVTHDSQTNVTNISGFVIDVFEAVIKALPYGVPYEFIPLHHEYYSDLIDQVYFQNVDAVVGDLTITANRSLYVDFTLPYTDLGVGLVARTENNSKWIFLEPLEADLWITIVAFLFLTGLVTWAIEHPINEEFQGSVAQQIGTVLWFSLSTLVSAQRERLQSHLSRFVVTIWVLVVLILTSSYTAIVSSLLTVQQIQLASKGGAIGYGDTPIVLEAIANTMDFNGSSLSACLTPQDCADALSRKIKDGGVSAVVTELPYLKLFEGKYSANQNYALIDTRSSTNGFGFVFQKGSPLVREISLQIARLREEGTLIALEKKWSQNRPSSLNQEFVTTPRVLGLDSFQGLFFISGVSLGLSVVIFLSYKVEERFHAKDNVSRIISRGKCFAMAKLFFPRSTRGIPEYNNCQNCSNMNPCPDCNS